MYVWYVYLKSIVNIILMIQIKRQILGDFDSDVTTTKGAPGLSKGALKKIIHVGHKIHV